MSKKHLLVPVDFTEVSLEAVRTAARLAAADTEITLLHVHDVLVLSNADPLCFGSPQFFYYTDFSDRLRAELGQIRSALLGEVAEVRLQTLVDSPTAPAICEYAATCGADLIVLGIGERSGLSRALKGSIADEIVRNAPCPVLVVRQKEHGDDDVETTTEFLTSVGAGQRDGNHAERHSDLNDALRSLQSWRPR